MSSLNLKQRAPAIVFLIIFCLLLLWPVLTLVGPTSWKMDTFEKRKLVTFPSDITVKWPRKFERYFDDNLPNRGALLRLNAWLKYYVFNDSSMKSVLVGKNGWLFHRVSNDMLEFEGRLDRKPYQIRRLRVLLEERRDWLAEHGISYLVLIAPTKQTVYPEKMPSWLKPAGEGHSRRELLNAELQHANSDLELLDFAPVLRESKNQFGDALYYQHDSHWNYLGALQAYTALAKLYPKWFRAPAADWENVLTPRSSNLMRMMGLPSEEMTEYPQPPDGFIALKRTPDTVLSRRMAKRGAVNLYLRPNSDAPRLYIMADSFAGWNSAYLAENFSRTALTNTWGGQWKRDEQFPIKNILAEQPSLVIDQMVENRLDLGVGTNLLVASKGASHLPEVRVARLRRLFRAAGQVNTEYRQSGNDLEIVKPVSFEKETYIVRLEIEVSESMLIESVSPYPADAAWYDRCKRGAELTEQTVKPGDTEVILCVSSLPDDASLRLHLGPGAMNVLKVEVTGHFDI
mgnify:CR=1 FL=1